MTVLGLIAMLLPTSYATKTSSVEILLNLWAERYTVDVSSLSKNPKFYGELVKAARPEARSLTASKLLNNVLSRTMAQVEIHAKSLYEYIPELINSQSGIKITQFACEVYQKLVFVYQQQSGLVVTPVTKQTAINGIAEPITLLLRAIPDIENIAKQLEESLLKYQEQHSMTNDRRLIGFLTTLFKFSNKILISQLTSVEKVLLCPYFKFVEEQISLPWQRICVAAASHQPGSQTLTLVERMLPLTDEISSTVYFKMLQRFPEHRNLRGGLGDPDVTHSSLRDLHMFQCYLWLCVLEGNLKPVENELVPLCVMVLPSVGVKWDMTHKWLRLLFDEIESRLMPEDQPIVLNYIQGTESAFFAVRQSLGDDTDIAIDLRKIAGLFDLGHE
jgi:hypothetical protein